MARKLRRAWGLGFWFALDAGLAQLRMLKGMEKTDDTGNCQPGRESGTAS